MDISIMVLMVGGKTGTGDGGWDGDVAVRLGLAFMRVVRRRGSLLRGGRGRGRGGEASSFSVGGGSGLERRHPPVPG